MDRKISCPCQELLNDLLALQPVACLTSWATRPSDSAVDHTTLHSKTQSSRWNRPSRPWGGVTVELYFFFNLGARWGGWSTPCPHWSRPAGPLKQNNIHSASCHDSTMVKVKVKLSLFTSSGRYGGTAPLTLNLGTGWCMVCFTLRPLYSGTH